MRLPTPATISQRAEFAAVTGVCLPLHCSQGVLEVGDGLCPHKTYGYVFPEIAEVEDIQQEGPRHRHAGRKTSQGCRVDDKVWVRRSKMTDRPAARDEVLIALQYC